MSDFKKFAIYQLRKLTHDLDLSAEEDIDWDKNFILVLAYELFESREISVKYEISDIFVNLSENSSKFNEILLDNEYLSKFLELTYSNSFPLIENILIIFGNIIKDFPEHVNYIIESIPLVYRIKEMIIYDKFDSHETIRKFIVFNLKIIACSINEERYIIVISYILTVVRRLHSINCEVLPKQLHFK
jgi:hypothetical protein